MSIENSGLIQQIVGNMLSGWGLTLVRAVIALVIVPFLLHHLGVEGFGLIGLMMVIISFANVSELGLRGALGRELSEKNAKNDVVGFQSLSSTALVLHLVISILVSFLGWFLAPYFVEIFNVNQELKEMAL